MALGLLDFIRRRKFYVVLGICIALVMILVFQSTSSRRYDPGNYKTGDSIGRSLSFDDASDTLVGLRTSDKSEIPRGEDLNSNPQSSNVDDLNGVPLNKGNVAQVQVLEKNHPPVEEDGGKAVEYPERGVEIKPVDGEQGKQEAELEPKDAGIDRGSNEEVGDVNIDKKKDSKSEIVATARNVDVDKPGSLQLKDKSQTTDDLYVHSSMPLGPALKIPHNERQRAVVDAIKHAWSSYKKYAWGEDDLLPLSKSHSSTDYGMAMTMIDSLDTLWLAGLQEEFTEARNWIAENLRFDMNTHKVIVFEVNIRVVGGLLSAYHLSQDRMFLEKAIDIGNRLLSAFDTPSGLPVNRVDLQKGLAVLHQQPSPNFGSVNIAEAGSLQLEFRDLSRASGDSKYQEAVDHDLNILLGSSSSGLYPQYFSVRSGKSSSSTFTVGAGADSFYEYLLKQWLQSNKVEKKFIDSYLKSAEAIKNHLIGYSKPSSLPYLGAKSGTLHGYLQSTMEHLACFYPGLLGLGLINNLHPEQRSLAEGLTQACYTAYNSTPSGLAADSFLFNTSPNGKSDYARASEAKNIQRPETVESLFVMYRLTKDPKYREWGWNIFKAFESNMRVDGGYASVRDVNRTPCPRANKMESFFLAETLKYLFLLFGDNDSIVSLNEWVFNTEAHLLPIWNSQGQ